MFPSTCAQNPSSSLPARIRVATAHLFQRVTAVERVALRGDEAGVGDDAAEFAFVGAVFYAGGEDDIFFDEDAADIVGAELQTDLADLDSRREPWSMLSRYRRLTASVFR